MKTVFHRGFESLLAEGGEHPFIISKLGSVVGSKQTAGVHFHGSVRERLYATHLEIAKRSKIVTVLTNRGAALWWKEHGTDAFLFQVPTGVEAELAPARRSPYPALGIEGPVALFAGNLYSRDQQAEVNLLRQERLNQLGRMLKRRGISPVAMDLRGLPRIKTLLRASGEARGMARRSLVFATGVPWGLEGGWSGNPRCAFQPSAQGRTSCLAVRIVYLRQQMGEVILELSGA